MSDPGMHKSNGDKQSLSANAEERTLFTLRAPG